MEQRQHDEPSLPFNLYINFWPRHFWLKKILPHYPHVSATLQWRHHSKLHLTTARRSFAEWHWLLATLFIRHWCRALWPQQSTWSCSCHLGRTSSRGCPTCPSCCRWGTWWSPRSLPSVCQSRTGSRSPGRRGGVLRTETKIDWLAKIFTKNYISSGIIKEWRAAVWRDLRW